MSAFLFRTLFAISMFFTFVVGQAQASQMLDVNFSGLTTINSVLPDGSAITVGTSFDVQAAFSDQPSQVLGTGIVEYIPTAINFAVGGTPYSVLNANLIDFRIILFDSSSAATTGAIVVLANEASSNVFGPEYSVVTPGGWSALAPTPAAFSQIYGESGNGSLKLPTADGNAVLIYDIATGFGDVTTSITVPEPSSLALLLIGSAGLFVRRRAVASA